MGKPQNLLSQQTEVTDNLKNQTFLGFTLTSITSNQKFPFYVSHVILDISIKGGFKSNKCLLFMESNTTPLI